MSAQVLAESWARLDTCVSEALARYDADLTTQGVDMAARAVLMTRYEWLLAHWRLDVMRAALVAVETATLDVPPAPTMVH